jgi:hypothetical protein
MQCGAAPIRRRLNLDEWDVLGGWEGEIRQTVDACSLANMQTAAELEQEDDSWPVQPVVVQPPQSHDASVHFDYPDRAKYILEWELRYAPASGG